MCQYQTTMIAASFAVAAASTIPTVNATVAIHAVDTFQEITLECIDVQTRDVLDLMTVHRRAVHTVTTTLSLSYYSMDSYCIFLFFFEAIVVQVDGKSRTR
jgi:alpha-acetolactate decarboxylase